MAAAGDEGQGGVHPDRTQTALQLAEKDSLTGQLRLANAAREAEARRADMVRSEARLEGQARISQLEAALRRAELDARDAVRKAELEAEEARKAEVRSAQLQITELKSQLRLERLEKESAAEKVRNEMRQAHSAEQRELELLRADAAEVHALRRARDEAVREKEAALARLAAAEAGMGGASNELMLAEQNTQLKQITKLQLQLAELQSELRPRDQGAGGGGGSAGAGARLCSWQVRRWPRPAALEAMLEEERRRILGGPLRPATIAGRTHRGAAQVIAAAGGLTSPAPAIGEDTVDAPRPPHNAETENCAFTSERGRGTNEPESCLLNERCGINHHAVEHAMWHTVMAAESEPS